MGSVFIIISGQMLSMFSLIGMLIRARVCMYVCMYVIRCVCVLLYVWTFVCVVRTRVRTHVCVCACYYVRNEH